MNKQDLIQQLSLVEHIEGGYFAETHQILNDSDLDPCLEDI